LEAGSLDQGEDSLHLALVVDVLGEDVLVERVARRPVDVEVALLLEGAGAFGEELPASFAGLAALTAGLELGAGPEHGPLGGGLEALGVEHGPLVVVAQEDHLALHDQVHALARVGAVADDVPQAVDLSDIVLVDVLEDGLQGLEVAVDVADDGLHAWPL